MNEFGKYRARLPPPPPARRESLLGTIAAAAAAFTISACIVLYWAQITSPGRWMPALWSTQAASTAPLPSGERIGRAATAPLLKLCVTRSMFGIGDDQDIDPAYLLDMLNASATAGRVAAIFGGARRNETVNLAAMWGEVADCVYRQNSWQLCDIDNRALAVQAANAFVRHADRAAAQATTVAATAGEVQALMSTRDRVIESLQNRVNSGALIASDFAPFAPSGVRAALGKTRTAGNACARP